MQWKRKTKKIPTNYSELQEIIIENRGLTSKQLEEFLEPINPVDITPALVGFDLDSFKSAVKMIQKTISDNKKIVIFGDYDADGICASAILWQTLYKLYSTKNPEGKNIPIPFIPHREKHGYGVSEVAIDEIIKKYKPDLIITVDNGIVAYKPVAYAKAKGIDIIVTDHHQPEEIKGKPHFPDATHIVHSTALCGATVAWMVAKELDKKFAPTLLDLAGIATIADQVPLLGANRSFAQFGVMALQKSTRVGFIALCENAGIKQNLLTEGTVGFSIAPRINAMGRLDHGLEALRLLCTTNPKQARSLAGTLNDTNAHRQDLTKQMLEEASSQLSEQAEEHLIIVYSEQFHEGILGLIAGNLTEKYHKPTIAITVSEGIAKASARSIYGVNIVDILRKIRADLLSVGGHPMAAGFSFEPAKLEAIKEQLFKIAKQEIKKEELEKSILVECLLPTDLVQIEVSENLEKFAPFGMSNPQPVFEVQSLEVLEVRTMGKEQEHLKLQLSNSKESFAHNTTAVTFDCIGWRMSDLIETITVGKSVSIVGVLSINEWRDTKKVQVILKDIKAIE